MTFQLPPIVKAAEQLCVEIEDAVRRFVRYHRYVIGTDLRKQAMHVYGLAERAWRDQAQQARWVVDLVWAIDELQRYLVASAQHRTSGARCAPYWPATRATSGTPIPTAFSAALLRASLGSRK